MNAGRLGQLEQELRLRLGLIVKDKELQQSADASTGRFEESLEQHAIMHLRPSVPLAV